MPIADAIARAEAAELDLVEIAPLAEPPVCRIMDFGKFKYREAKRAHEAKLKLKQIQVKEVKFRPGTDEGDYQIKLRNLINRGKLADAQAAAQQARYATIQYAEQLRRRLEATRRDVRSVDWEREVPELVRVWFALVVSHQILANSATTTRFLTPAPV